MTGDWMKYLEGMTPDQMKEAVRALSPEQRADLVQAMCGRVNQIATSIVQHSEHVWLTGELPEEP